jgi:drug/metabolite transporter (DMT)-like permease
MSLSPSKPASAKPPSSTGQRRPAILMLLLANLFWGLSFPLIRAIELLNARWVPSGGWFVAIYTIAPRFVLSFGLLLALQARQGYRVTRRELKLGLILGFFGAGGMLLQNDGLRFTDASTSAFLTQFYAILIPIWLALRARRGPGLIVGISTILVLAGVALLGHFNWSTLRFGRGELETLASSLFFMVQILWLDRKEFADNRAGRVTLVMFAVEVAVFGALAAATAPDVHALLAPWTSPAWVGLTLLLTVFCTLASFSIMNAWQPKITAIEAGLLYCIEPIFASLLALVVPGWISLWAGIDYPNERATMNLLIGGALITLANALIQLRRPAKG